MSRAGFYTRHLRQECSPPGRGQAPLLAGMESCPTGYQSGQNQAHYAKLETLLYPQHNRFHHDRY
jgi:hypothetical protein